MAPSSLYGVEDYGKKLQTSNYLCVCNLRPSHFFFSFWIYFLMIGFKNSIFIFYIWKLNLIIEGTIEENPN